MVTFLPFRGWQYAAEPNAQGVANVTPQTAPPYDVISAAQRQAFANQHPHNVVRFILPQPEAGKTPYESAHSYWQQWQTEGALTLSPQPAYYAYTQTTPSTTPGHPPTVRQGLIGALLLEPYETRQVLPHERIIHQYLADRFALETTCMTNFSQVFLLYDDPALQIEAQVFAQPQPSQGIQHATDADGVVHTWWPITDSALQQAITQVFSDKQTVIADGHHRYQTALTIREAARATYRERFGHDAAAGSLTTDYRMVFCTNMASPGLAVFPTHRQLRYWPEGWTQASFETALTEKFSVTRLTPKPSVSASPEQQRLDMYAHPLWQNNAILGYERIPTEDDTSRIWLLTPIANSHPDLPEGHPLSALDVAWLDRVLWEGLFGQSAQALKEANALWFERDEATVVNRMTNHDVVATFWVHAPNVHDVKAVCDAGCLMPQKSTYFYPKLVSGSVFFPLGTLPDNTTALTNVRDDLTVVDTAWFTQPEVPQFAHV